jgi:hypothetical protein
MTFRVALSREEQSERRYNEREAWIDEEGEVADDEEREEAQEEKASELDAK